MNDEHQQTLLVIRRDRRLINHALERILQFGYGAPPRLMQAMRYAVLSPGKRLRPILCLESFRACGGKNKRWIIPFCCGIEFLHTFSLIHDDLPAMDNDDLRRGRATLHRQFDEATAILAADALLVLGYETFLSSPAPLNRRIEAISLLSRAIGMRGMVSGQVLDITQREKKSDYLRVARLKTGELIAASIATGGIIAGAARTLRKRLYRLGLMLGMLFQLTDDLLDIQQDDQKNKKRGASIDIQKEAMAIAQRTQRAFTKLGQEFSFFTGIVKFILERKK